MCGFVFDNFYYTAGFMEKLFIGLDFGSDSVRALLVDGKGMELSSAVANYRRWSMGKYCDAAKGQFRQHPADYLEAMEKVIGDVLTGQAREKVAGIALDTTGSTPCVVNAAGTPLALLPEFADDPDAMFVLWKDHTGIVEEQRINECAANWGVMDFRKYAGGIYSCEWFWSKLLHVLRSSEKVRNAAFSFVEHCDYMVGVLTGNCDPLTMFRSRCAAGHKAMWHPEWDGLPPEEFLCTVDPLLAGFRERLYQKSFTVDTPAGKISPYWAEKFGLSSEVVIGGCALDCHTGAIGAQIAPGRMVKVLGTSTCDILVAPALERCIPGVCGQVNGSVLPGMDGIEAGQSAFGDIYAWFKRFLGYAGEVSLENLEKEAAAIAPGTTQITVLDYFNGRRTPFADPTLTGMIAGLNLGTTPPMLYRGLVESTVFGSRAILDHYRKEKLPVNEIVAVGGISRKSCFVMQMCADVLGLPIKVARTDQACALGAAMIAACCSGGYASLSEAMESMGAGFSVVYTPDPEKSAVYETLYQRYLALVKLQSAL